MNTLLYLMYARHNFVFCKAIIEQCIVTGCDLEYPYYVKVMLSHVYWLIPNHMTYTIQKTI